MSREDCWITSSACDCRLLPSVGPHHGQSSLVVELETSWLRKPLPAPLAPVRKRVREGKVIFFFFFGDGKALLVGASCSSPTDPPLDLRQEAAGHQ